MKVLALNGSPRKEESNTERLMAPLLEGMRTAGAEVDYRYLEDYELHQCAACFGCWVRTPGLCHNWRDGMDELLPAFNASELVILGFPLYVYTLPARVKVLIERLLPIVEPWFAPHKTVPGLTTHPRRNPQPDKLFIVSSAGFAERAHYSSLIATVEQIALMLEMEVAGTLLRPGAALLGVPGMEPLLRLYYQRVRAAGEELAREGRLSPATQEGLNAELVPGGAGEYNAQCNHYWQQRLAKYGNWPPQSEGS